MTALWLYLAALAASVLVGALVLALYGLCALLAVHNINRRDE